MFFPDNPAAGLYAGLGTVIGHNWPAFKNLKVEKELLQAWELYWLLTIGWVLFVLE